MAIQQNFPSSRPSLSLNFARSKKLDPRITFTRTSSATYVGEDGLIKIAPANEARFDHDPITGDSLGLFVEEGRQNLWNNSNDFTVWTKQTSSPGVVGVATTTATTSPDGNFNAYRYFVEAGGGSFYSIYRGVAGISSNTSYCFSVFAKAGEISSIVLIVFDGVGTSSGISFNLNTGSAGVAFNGSNTTIGAGTTITNYGNGWYRCAVVFSSTISGNGFQFKTDLPGPPSVGQGLFVYGAQLEQGAFPTSYIPTTASTVTRTLDSASMTGSNFSSWYRQDEGTVLITATPKYVASGTNNRIFVVSPDGDFTNSLQPGGINIDYAGLSIRNEVFSGVPNSLQYASTSSSGVSSNFTNRIGFGYKNNNMSFIVDGSIISTNNSTIVPLPMTRLGIGRRPDSPTIASGLFIKTITYYPSRLPNQIIQNLTK
jgi:hypothetical protein